MSSKVNAFCMIVFLLIFTLSSTAARPEPTASQIQHPNIPIETQNLDTVEVDDITCEGMKEEEECLMRRTLAAHVDYIYTQKTTP